jgi:hypothetical protein
VSDDTIRTAVEPPAYLCGGKRTNIERSEGLTDWWFGYGKDKSCDFEGSWAAMAILAAKILSHPATGVATPNLYRPDLADALTPEQAANYTEEPHVTWPKESS